MNETLLKVVKIMAEVKPEDYKKFTNRDWDAWAISDTEDPRVAYTKAGEAIVLDGDTVDVYDSEGLAVGTLRLKKWGDLFGL